MTVAQDQDQTMPQPAPFRRAQRAAALSLSEIVRISEAARALQAEGKPVLTFGTGEPDFPTPPHVIDAAMKAARAGQTTYPPTQGTPALRKAIAAQAGFDFDPTQVLVSTGAKQVLSNAFQATLDPGDEVILPAPYWTSYGDMFTFCGAKQVVVETSAETGFLLTPEALEAAITDKTRWLLLNTPGNPSGAMYSEAQLAALADVLRRHPHVWVIADEIYQHIAYAPFASFVSAAPDLADRTLIVNGVSKAHAMTGWRLGWGIGPASLIKAMVAVQGQSTSGASSISQAAALAALTGPQDHLATRCDAFKSRRDMVVSALNTMPGLTCPVPEGAFYVFPSCAGTIGRKRPDGSVIETDADLCDYLLNEALVALVPGRAFGLPGHFRLSYAYSTDNLTEGLARISRALDALTD
ncbi:pyridoxal phosphate-dependent aminotransferase [Aliiroseovarius sp. KMU-50]|uniref:Aminotransferase n=1 Tax=Aliiroseovarius salicola TaxID=3009082 RepID=A0ABT4W528_9RHOB|nr:pyridoxal phosphate-dependent aminotransferase [Aliiroseovarius sp. KMU-50]MDA5095625.1 pyridoxal phosphate-dependent aminotransferase [Aliiroseovarius sp. KMU-50]